MDAERETVRLSFTSLMALNLSGAASQPGNLRVRLAVDNDDLPPFDALYLPVTVPPPVGPTATTAPAPAGSGK